MLTGQILAIVLYVRQVDLAGFNLGLVCLAVNVAVLAAVHLAMKRPHVHVLS
jgi:SSS family solute:Na+ symporter